MQQVPLHTPSQLDFIISFLPFLFSIPCSLSLTHFVSGYGCRTDLYLPARANAQSHVEIKDSGHCPTGFPLGGESRNRF